MDIKPWFDDYNTSWDTLGPTLSQSMPHGRGDIALNVWFEQEGDLSVVEFPEYRSGRTTIKIDTDFRAKNYVIFWFDIKNLNSMLIAQ